jgi:hypothetical protein
MAALPQRIRNNPRPLLLVSSSRRYSCWECWCQRLEHILIVLDSGIMLAVVVVVVPPIIADTPDTIAVILSRSIVVTI